jgi:myo-inositol-1(or 4)-monophosphatase
MDAAAERLILAELARHRPGDPVVAEESGTGGGDGPVTWHVDPLDGTVNYLYGRSDWCVSIAAVIDGVTVAGVVHDPGRRRMYAATVAGEATCNGVPLRCSTVVELGQTLLATGFSYAAPERAQQAEVIARLLPVVRDIRRGGSAALDLCDVAAGRADAYLEEGGHSWDWLAGELIAERAGCGVARSDHGITGRPLQVAAAPAVLDALLEALRAAGIAVAARAGGVG